MKIKITKPLVAFAFLAVFGFASGAVNGLFGTGGGIVAVFALSHIPFFKNLLPARALFATTLFAAFLMSLSSVFIYARTGRVDFAAALPFLPAALAGGCAGAFLQDKIKTAVLSKIFALLVLYAGLTLIWR